MTRHDDDNYSVSSLGSSGSDRDGGRLQDDLHPHSEVAPTEDETSTKEEPHASISGTESTTTTKTWTPVSLHRMVLLGYAVLFIVIIVALEVLNYLSNRNQGLATVSENLYYLWKFGLTFILIIIIAFWAHVEYSSKLVMPWMVLAKSGNGSSHGFTLNYMTTTIPEALFLSLKANHLPVFLGVMGTLLLRLLVIFSTGLLTAEDKLMTHNETVLVLDHFNFSKAYGSAIVDDELVTLWATSNVNLSYPSATTSDFATQSVFISNSSMYEPRTFDAQFTYFLRPSNYHSI